MSDILPQNLFTMTDNYTLVDKFLSITYVGSFYNALENTNITVSILADFLVNKLCYSVPIVNK